MTDSMDYTQTHLLTKLKKALGLLLFHQLQFHAQTIALFTVQFFFNFFFLILSFDINFI